MPEAVSPDRDHPLILNLKEFLSKPFERLEVGILPSPPDLDFLKWMPSLKDEAGLVLQKPKWFIIKASGMGVPSFLLPKLSDTLLHSHPFGEEDERDERSVPSLGDFVNCSPTAKNLIISQSGITQYWYVGDQNKRKVLEAELKSFSPRFNDKKTHLAYLEFLKVNQAKFELHPWHAIAEQNLNELLYP